MYRFKLIDRGVNTTHEFSNTQDAENFLYKYLEEAFVSENIGECLERFMKAIKHANPETYIEMYCQRIRQAEQVQIWPLYGLCE